MADSVTLPTADEFFGGSKQLPTADEFFAEPKTAIPGGMGYMAGDLPASSAEMDEYFHRDPVGRILKATGQGMADAWGAEPLGFSDQSVDYLRKSGMFTDLASEHFNATKAFNEAWMRPAAVTLDAANRAMQSGFAGAQALVATAGAEAGMPSLGRDIAAAPEAFFGSPHPTGVPQIIDIPKARNLGVLGTEGEYFGTQEKRPLTPEEYTDAMKAQISLIDQERRTAGAYPSEPEPLAPAPQPDIHQIAREVDPETFEKFDALSARKETFRRWINELDETRRARAETEAPHGQEIADLQDKMEGATPRLQKKYQARIDEMQETRDAFIEERTKGDSADMTKVRQRLMETDYAMRDLSTKVGTAYREAEQRIPKEETAEVPVAEPAAEVPAAEPAPIEAANKPEEPASAPQEAAQRPVETTTPEQVKSISADVTKKLIDAGQPQDVAEATGRLWASHYWARANRFNGTKGNGLDLYNAEAPDVVGKTPRNAGAVREFAQTAKAKLKVMANDVKNILTLFRGRADASSVIHETGHQWLEEMMKDAADPAAPTDLIADTKTVRTWLGAEEGKELTRSQHEKFARGFETYMMEGRAPSAGLARVFEQFRQWLTEIYKTISSLKSPISDDIRDVFDRLVTTKPERTVIAPEREPGKAFADLHETDAEAATPEQAHENAERVRAERDAVAAEKLTPEEQNDRLANITEQDGRREAGGAKPNGNVAPAESPARETGTAAEPGKVSEGGNPTAPEGARAPEDPAKVTNEKASAGKTLPSSETDLIDKAGNIRLDNLNTPEDINTILRKAADDAGIGEHTDYVSDQAMLDIKEAIGFKVAFTDLQKFAEKFGHGQLAARIEKLRELLVQSAAAVRDAATKAAAGTEEDLLAFAESVERHKMLQSTMGTLSAVTAEMGRGLRAFRALRGEADLNALVQDTLGKTLFQLKKQAKAISELDSAAKTSGAIHDMEKPGLGAMALEIFKNWLIAGPITHSTYAIGNATLAIWKAIPETAAQAAVGLVREAIQGKSAEPRVRFGEIGAQLYALLKGQRDGWMAAYDSFKAGQTQALPHEVLDALTKPQRAKFDKLISEGATFEQAMATFGLDVKAPTSMVFTSTQAVPNFNVAGVPIPLGSTVRFPGERMVAPIHSYFRTIGYIQSIARQAYRAASEEGLEGNAFNARVAEITRSPTEAMMETARNEATEQTLMGKGGEFTKRVSGLINWQPNLPLLGPTKPLAFVDPFVHIASNIFEQAVLQRGPLGILTEKTRADIAGRNGTLAKDTTIARMAMGTSLTATGMGLYTAGFLNKSSPSDAREAYLDRRVNGMPHSLKIGNLSIDLSRLGVLGIQMGIAADLGFAADKISHEEWSEVGALVVHSIAQNFLDEGFMRGPSDMIKALDEPDRHGASYMTNLLSSAIVPYSVGMQQIASRIDPYAREARTLMDKIIRKIPWESESLEPQIDMWGIPVQNREYIGVYAQRIASDPVDRELLRLGVYPSKPKREINGVELTPQQYTRYQQIAGQMARHMVEPIITNIPPGTIPDGVKSDLIHSAINKARQSAQQLIKVESITSNNNIVQQAIENKQEHLQ